MTAATSATPETLVDLLARRAQASPAEIAFAYEAGDGWKTITWREFHQRVSRLAHALCAGGLEPGDRVGILAPTGLGWELFHHAILAAGGVVVGLEPHDLAERLCWIIDHAEVKYLVVGDEKLLAKVDDARLARLAGLVLMEPASAPVPRARTWTELEMHEGAHEELPRIAADDPATLIYTSGTTGQPKGILYRHMQVQLAVRALREAYPSISVGARFVCWLPLANLFQRIMNLAAMYVGGLTYLVKDPLSVMGVLPVAKPEVFIGVPRFYEKLYEGMQQNIARQPRWRQRLIHAALGAGARVAEARRQDMTMGLTLRAMHRLADSLVMRAFRAPLGGRIRFMITGSAPTPRRLLDFFDALGLPLFEAYGMSENVVPMALNRPGAWRPGTVGKPLPENEMRLDSDGELLVKGAGVFQGYHKDPREELFTADGYYRTGDYASFDHDGFLVLLGRKSEIIKTSTGRRIAPGPIEAALEQIPDVERAIVIGAGRKCLTALLILTAGAPVRAMWQAENEAAIAELLAALRQRIEQAVSVLPPVEQPAGFLVCARQLTIESGDLTPNLKLRRKAIETRHAEELERLYDAVDRRAEIIVLRSAIS